MSNATKGTTETPKVSKDKLKALAAKATPTKAEATTAEVKKELVKKITEKKDLKYIYPEDCITLEMRKKFRHKTRQLLATYSKKLNNATKGKLEGITPEAVLKEFNKLRKERLTGFKPEPVETK